MTKLHDTTFYNSRIDGTEFRSEKVQLAANAYASLQRELGVIIPPRSAIKPRNAMHFIRNMMIIEIAPPQSAIVRLMGTGLTLRTGQELTGRNLMDLMHEDMREMRYQHFVRLLETPCSTSIVFSAEFDNLAFDLEMLDLPLIDKNGQTRLILSVLDTLDLDDLAIPYGQMRPIDNVYSVNVIDIGAGIDGFYQRLKPAS